jgi:hypothetical protein
MSNLLQWYGPEVGTAWNQTRIYRSATETGTYSLIATVAVSVTKYFDETGASSDWYKVAFYDSLTLVQGPLSAAFYASSTPTMYTNPTELRKFMQFNTTDFPVDEDVTLLLEQVHVQLTSDVGNITNSGKLKLLALFLGASFVCRSLATRALSKGYVSVSLEGGSIMKAHDALMRLADYYFEKYQEQLAKDTVDYSSTSFLGSGGLDATSIQDIKDIMNGVTDGYDYQSSFRSVNQDGQRNGR